MLAAWLYVVSTFWISHSICISGSLPLVSARRIVGAAEFFNISTNLTNSRPSAAGKEDFGSEKAAVHAIAISAATPTAQSWHTVLSMNERRLSGFSLTHLNV
jgi:hypothetical protein